MASGVEVATGYLTIIPTTEGMSKNLTSAVSGAASTAGQKAGSILGGGISDGLKKFVVPAGIIGGIAAIGKAGFDAYTKVEEGANNVIKATGATGEAAKELKGVYKDVASQVVGDFGDIGAAVGELNTRLGLTGKDLEAASIEMMKYAKVTGQDAVAATKDVASMMRNTGIPASKLADTLGKLTVAGQAAGIDVAKLAQNTTKYNAVMKQLGLTTDEQIALMAQFEVSGADTASILNAMKRGVASWAKEGKDARVEFEAFVKGVQDGTVTAGDAVEIFGSRGGLSMYEAAQKGQLSFEEMFKAIEGASQDSLDTVYDDTLSVTEKMDLAWQNITLAMAEIFEPIMTALADFLTTCVVPVVQGIRDFASEIGQRLQPVIEAVTPFLEGLGEVLGTVLTVAFEAVATAIGAFADAIKWVWDNVLAPFGQFLADTLGPIIEAIGDMVKGLVDGIKQAVDWIVGAWNGLTGAIKNGMQASVNASATYGNTMLGMYTGNWSAIEKQTGQTFGDVNRTVDANMSAASGSVSRNAQAITNTMAFPGMPYNTGLQFQAAANAMQTPIVNASNVVKSQPGEIVNSYSGLGGRMTSAVGSVSFPTPHVSYRDVNMLGKSLPLPVVEWYATGGVFDNPSIIGVGEAGREVVAPEPMLREIVSEEAGDMSEVVGLLQALLAKDTGIYLDGRELVESTVGRTDRALGNRKAMSRRGVAVYG